MATTLDLAQSSAEKPQLTFKKSEVRPTKVDYCVGVAVTVGRWLAPVVYEASRRAANYCRGALETARAIPDWLDEQVINPHPEAKDIPEHLRVAFAVHYRKLSDIAIPACDKILRVVEEVSEGPLAWPVAMSKALVATMHYPYMAASQLTGQFRELPCVEQKPHLPHTHPTSAASRSSAGLFCDRLAANLGYIPYYWQRSVADERKGRNGSKVHMFSRHIESEPAYVRLTATDMVVMVDSDYHFEMDQFLANHHNPVVLYTFAPRAVAAIRPEYCYTFDENDEVDYRVTGGGRYRHKVWNYSHDSIMAVSYVLGVPVRCVAYKIERISTDLDHEIVLLAPQGYWTGPAAIVASWWYSHNRLQRLRVCTGDGFTHLTTFGKDGLNLSVGKVGQFASCELPLNEAEACAAGARSSDYRLAQPTVAKYVQGDKVMAPVLLEYLRRDRVDVKALVFLVEQAVRGYQAYPKDYDETASPGLKAYMSPIVHGAFAPDRCYNNDRKAIEGRVEGVRPPLLEMTPELQKHMSEFLQFFIEKPWQLHPYEYDDVLDRQTKPTQRALLIRGEHMDVKHSPTHVESFVKTEPYGEKTSDPRIISTIQTAWKREYSKYTYSLSDGPLKSAPWYAFGKSPEDIALRITTLLSGKEEATNTDYSRFDGHGSNLMREFERQLLLRAFHPRWHSTLIELHRSQYGLKGITTFGVHYETGYSRLSGSPETSCFNSLVNAFVAYIALRRTRGHDGLYHSPLEAYARLGIYGGDDGLTAEVDVQQYVRSAIDLGQVLTVEPIKRGEFGIKFLARVYSPEVWFGDVNSCCDLKRQIAKFHTTANMPQNITPVMKLTEKARAFLLNDRYTPILGEFCRAVETICGGEIKRNDVVHRLLNKWEPLMPGQYPHWRDDWMVWYAENALAGFNLDLFLDTIRDAVASANLEALLAMPCCLEPEEPKTPFPVVVDNAVLPVDHKMDTTDRPAKAPEATVDKQHHHLKPKKGKEPKEVLMARKKAAGTWVEEANWTGRPAGSGVKSLHAAGSRATG